MSLIYVKVGLFFVAICAAALFSFLETAFTALRLFKVKQLAISTSRFNKLFEVWENNPKRILITILLASNFAHVFASVLVTDIVQAILGDTGVALAVGVFTATGLILVFGEIIPKSYAKAHSDGIFRPALWMINLLFYGLHPIVSFLIACTDFFTHKFGARPDDKSDIVSEKEIEFLIDYGDEKGLIEADKSEMLQNIFSMGDTLTKEIMVPATDMVSIDVNESLENAMKKFIKYKYTRLPVFKGREDNFIGLIHQKEVFEVLIRKQNKSLAELVMPIKFVPETNKAMQLLRDFLTKRLHMAIVVNEHGEVTGLITLEDMIEEIVGEISDEHETVHQEIIPLDDGGWLVDARVDLEKLEEKLGIKFKVEESITLGGFLAEKLQHLPKKGERVFYNGYCFQVQSASSTRVHQVLVFVDDKS